jgi:glycosyltransferase involved in cell wall biosynthesis
MILGVQSLLKFTRIVLINIVHFIIGKKIDFVIYHNYVEQLHLGLPISRFYNSKIIYYFHGSAICEFPIYKINLINQCSGLITISGENNDCINTEFKNIINNIEYEKIEYFNLNLNPEKVYFVSTSNIEENKNIHYLIDLFSDLSIANSNIVLHLYGKVSDVNYFNDKIKAKLNTLDNVFYFGPKSNSELISLLHNYHAIFQLSKFKEGNSMSVIEAIVYGKIPAIVNNIGGMPLVVNNELFGCVINCNDSNEINLNKIQNKILDFTNYSRLIKNILEQGREYFSPNKSSLLLEEFLQRIQ